jgi:glycosyltransferase involved in cell wall biosynthesis
VAEASSVSVIIPAFNEAAAIGAVLAALGSSAPWHEIIVIDDGSTDGTAELARNAGATVIRHPYNKGNGASVKSGIRAASGAYLLIMDGDGQHSAADALRLVGYLGEYDLVVGARAASGQASAARRLGNSVLNGLASYLTGRHIPDLTSGMRTGRTGCFREFLHLLPNGFSTPTTTTLACLRAGYSVRFEPIDAGTRLGRSKIRLLSDGANFFLILLKVITVFSP